MLKNKTLQKLLAMILIFTLTFSNFAFTTKALATSVFDTLFGNNDGTGHENVEFEAYFETEEEKSTSVTCDVNKEDLAINVQLNVFEAGYLKDAKIEVKEPEEGEGLNFVLKENPELSEMVQNFDLENNTLELKQIDNGSNLNIQIPIEYKNEKYINENKLSKDSKVIFTGTYIDDEGEEIPVSKEITLHVSWRDDRKFKIESEVSKYIQFGNEEKGVILQTTVKVDGTTENKTLPVKETKLNVEVPKVNDTLPTNITILAVSTQGTNGKFAEDVVFDSSNWTYDEETNTITITVQNEKELVKVDEFEEEYLKDINKEIPEEERYYSESGVDEFLITYTYQNVNLEETTITTSDVSAEVKTFSGTDDEIVVNENQNYQYELVGQTGDIVSYNIENETKEVSKAYTYLNYNTDNNYEIEYKYKNIVNVSIKDMVEEMVIQDVEQNYVLKDGSELPTNDLYYKEISMSKENINAILGEDGNIDIIDEVGNIIQSINKDYPVTEDGKVVVNFENRVNKITLKTTKPVSEGILSINYTKASQDTELSKEQYKDVDKVISKMKMTAKYSYVEDMVEIGEAVSEIKINDTKTKVNLVIDRNNFSTITKNTNVEMRVELNNHLETSDIFGNSTFDIEFPEYITNINLLDTKMVYGEGLDIANSEVLNENGKFIIRVTIAGKQETLNSGVLTNGANIEVYADIDVDLFAPAKEESIRLYTSNSEATNVENEYEEVKINYSAPTGVVAVNTTSNYNNNGNTLTSVRQGRKEDILEIYTDAKQAKMEIIVMNNNSNTISEIAILGRIPFAGVKDILTGEELGTTLDTKLIQGIVPDERNNGEFRVYYSENGEATKDLNDSQNGWIENPESLENMKSYLIVPADENYEMNETEILRFSYVYEIPANLGHNESVYGTFLTYYKNNSEIAVTDETSAPDIIGLTTGQGPELSIETTTNTDKLSQYEELKITSIVKNTGNSVVENAEITVPIPEYAKYSTVELENQDINYTVNEQNVVFNVNSIDVGAEVKVSINVIIEKCPTIEEYYKETEGFMIREDGQYVIRTYNEIQDIDPEDENAELEYTDEVLTNPIIKIDVYSTVRAKDLQKELSSEIKQVEIEAAEFEIVETTEELFSEDGEEIINDPGRELVFNIIVRNLTAERKNNIIVTKQIPEELVYSNAYYLNYEEDGITSYEVNDTEYDEATRTITWKLDYLDPEMPKQFVLKATVGDITDGNLRKDLYSSSKVLADGTKTYESNTVQTKIGKPSLEISQTTPVTNTYIKEGNIINYTFTVKNVGYAPAKNVKLTDNIPEGLVVRKISYVSNGVSTIKRVSASREAVIDTTILAGQELVANIEALAVGLDGVQEKTITNFGKVKADGIAETNTNEITHIIEADTSRGDTVVEKSNTALGEAVDEENRTSNIVKTYKLSGVAWLDDNKDGKRDEYETRLTNITASLVDVNTGYIVKNVATDSRGEYNFSGVQEGDYIVVFDYDTVTYTVTTYRKSGIESNVNSDAIITQVEQNGRKRNAAVTDTITIKDGSISNVDIGLALADTFDLKLDMCITRATVQNRQGTNNIDFDRVQLGQVPVTGKYLTGTTVYIRYNITVTNQGEIAGYAKKIIDYIPEGMTYNSELNPDWYTGSDGMLYTTALENEQLQPGESREVTLVLTKQMTEENTGLINNRSEIFEDYNIYGVSDKNSTPGNQAQNENDISKADIMITVKTGEVFIHVSVIITSILLGSIVIFIAYTKLILKKKKGGA